MDDDEPQRHLHIGRRGGASCESREAKSMREESGSDEKIHCEYT